MKRILFTSAVLFFTFAGNIYSCSSATNNKQNPVDPANSNMSEEQTNHTGKHYDTAVFAGGCFWGVQYFFEKAQGVINTEVGYTGGHVANPTYEEVCSHTTGHYEAIRVVYDPAVTTYEKMVKLFFDIHDPTQTNGQGPDIGQQYMSVIFYRDAEQKKVAEDVMNILRRKGYNLATQLIAATTFWPAEKYHEHHYDKEGGVPYCHRYEDKFK